MSAETLSIDAVKSREPNLSAIGGAVGESLHWGAGTWTVSEQSFDSLHENSFEARVTYVHTGDPSEETDLEEVGGRLGNGYCSVNEHLSWTPVSKEGKVMSDAPGLMCIVKYQCKINEVWTGPTEKELRDAAIDRVVELAIRECLAEPAYLEDL